MKPLIQYIEVIEDPRDVRGKKYKRLSDLLIMTIYGILNGHSDFSNISVFLKVHEEYFKNLLNISIFIFPNLAISVYPSAPHSIATTAITNISING